MLLTLPFSASDLPINENPDVDAAMELLTWVFKLEKSCLILTGVSDASSTGHSGMSAESITKRCPEL